MSSSSSRSIGDTSGREALETAFGETVREREEQLRMALEAGRMGTWEWDVATSEVRWSAGLEAIHGLAPGTFAGTFAAYRSDVHPDDRERVAHAIAKTLEEGREHQIEYRIVWPDGSVRWVEGRGRMLRDASGRPVRALGICMDVTERKQAEEVLRASEERFASFMRHLPGLAWIKDAQGRYLFANEAAERAFRTTSAGLYGRADEEIFPAATAEVFRENDRRALVEGGVQTIEKLEQADGVVHHSLVSKFPIPGTDGTTMIGGIAFDVTDRVRSEEALRDADRRKDEFLATLAHELRNPLAPLRNGLAVLKLGPGDADAAEKIRTMMERQLGHMVRLIDDLLDLSRVSRGRITLRRERIAIADVVRQAVEASRHAIEEAGHELTVGLPPEAVIVDADPVRLAQVLSNLLGNAAKFTPRGGHVRLTARRRGGEAVVAVRDDGIGIPADMLPKLFDMFIQVDRSPERAQLGLGIGLSLVKGLVELHGGSVEARSEGSGRGSEFVVRLPIAAGADAPAAPRDVPARPAPRRRILVVDDNRDAATSLAAVLELMGNEIAIAYDGVEAIAIAERFAPEVILLDVGMPKLDGYGVARRLRDTPGGRSIRLVAVTGWGQEGDLRRAREAGFDDHMVKPVDPAALETLLAGLAPMRAGGAFPR